MNQNTLLRVDKTVSKINYVARHIHIHTDSHTVTCRQTNVTKLTGASGDYAKTSEIQGDRGFMSSGM